MTAPHEYSSRHLDLQLIVLSPWLLRTTGRPAFCKEGSSVLIRKQRKTLSWNFWL